MPRGIQWDSRDYARNHKSRGDLFRHLASVGHSPKLPASLLAWPGTWCGFLSAIWGRVTRPWERTLPGAVPPGSFATA